MGIQRLDHVNIRTSRLEEMTVWYEEVLGLTSGWRPPFPFPGAWLYAGENPIVHLVAVGDEPSSDMADLKLEHAAFRATDHKGLIARLEARGEDYKIADVPNFDFFQINVWDPDGNHLHIDFDGAERA